MSKTAKRLGRGLDSLVSNLRAEESIPPRPAVAIPREPTETHGPAARVAADSGHTNTAPGAATVPVNRIMPNPFQPRRDMLEAELDSLSESIRLHGVLQPISVRRVGDKFQIIAGERRWRASRKAGLLEIPAVIRVADDQQMLELALIENLEREDLNAIDRAKAYRQFCDEFGLSPEEVASRLAGDRTTIVNYLRLLDLEEDVQSLVAAGKLNMGHARCLLGVLIPTRRPELAERAVSQQLSVRALEELVRKNKSEPSGKQRETAKRPPHLKELETRFEQAIKTKVSIQEGRRKGSGRLIIEYYSLDDFDRIASLFGVQHE